MQVGDLVMIQSRYLIHLDIVTGVVLKIVEEVSDQMPMGQAHVLWCDHSISRHPVHRLKLLQRV